MVTGLESVDEIQLKIKDRLKHNIQPSCIMIIHLRSRQNSRSFPTNSKLPRRVDWFQNYLMRSSLKDTPFRETKNLCAYLRISIWLNTLDPAFREYYKVMAGSVSGLPITFYA